MKLFKVWQDHDNGLDTYEAAVVAAKNEAEARTVNPSEYSMPSEWSEPAKLHVELIGTAVRGTKKGCIVASFVSAE